MKPLVTTRSLSWLHSLSWVTGKTIGKTTGKTKKGGNKTGVFWTREQRTSAVEREAVFLTCFFGGGCLFVQWSQKTNYFQPIATRASSRQWCWWSICRHDPPKKNRTERHWFLVSIPLEKCVSQGEKKHVKYFEILLGLSNHGAYPHPNCHQLVITGKAVIKCHKMSVGSGFFSRISRDTHRIPLPFFLLSRLWFCRYSFGTPNSLHCLKTHPPEPPILHRKKKTGFLRFQLCWLVVLTILKNISQWEGLSHIYPYIMENKKCSKPPTSIYVPTKATLGMTNVSLGITRASPTHLGIHAVFLVSGHIQL